MRNEILACGCTIEGTLFTNNCGAFSHTIGNYTIKSEVNHPTELEGEASDNRFEDFCDELDDKDDGVDAFQKHLIKAFIRKEKELSYKEVLKKMQDFLFPIEQAAKDYRCGEHKKLLRSIHEARAKLQALIHTD